MKKSSRYIAICITALFLSICIPVVSIAMETSITYLEPSSMSYSNGIFYLVTDSSSDFPPTFTNFYTNLGDYNYGYIMTNSLSSYSSYQFDYTYNISGNYNSFEVPVVIAQTNSSYSLNVFFRESSGGREYYISLSAYYINRIVDTGNPYYSSDYDIYVDASLISNPGPTGDHYIYLMRFYTQSTRFKIYRFQEYHSFGNLSGHFLLPIYKLGMKVTTYTEWEQEQKQMHDDTINEISQIGDDVSRVGNEVSRVGSEVSRVGEEISQFHNDLTSYDESDAPSVNDYNMSDNIDTINSFDTEISNFIDDHNGYTSYDYDSEYSGIGDNFSWDEQSDGDMSFWDFVVNLWGTLQMRVVIVAFVPLAFAYVILKFVIGGIM